MKSRLFVAALFLAASGAQAAACVAVGPSSSGDGSGSNWTNRRALLPATLTLGTTYYLMDGTYGHMDIGVDNVGTTVTVVKKAQTYDYGRSADGCTNDISAGWNAATMGAGQAVWNEFDSSGDNDSYVTIDGNGANTAIGCGDAPGSGLATKDCGIKFQLASGLTGGDIILVDLGYNGSTNTGWIFRSVEMQGGYPTPVPSGDNESVMKCTNAHCDALTIEHNYWHDAGCDFFKPSHFSSMTFRYNFVRKNKNGVTCHSQFFLSDGTISNMDFYGNIIEDIEGTAVFSILNSGQASNWRIYSNVFAWTNGNDSAGVTDGVWACINSGSKCTNIQFIGNSFVNLTGAYNNSAGIHDENGGGSYTWQNNLTYLCVSRQDSGGPYVSFNTGGSTFTEDHNTWLSCGNPASGTGDVIVTSSPPNPFVNWQADNFRLASANAYWGNAVSKSAPFNVDMYGVTHGADGTWDRGAIDFGTGSLLPKPENPRWRPHPRKRRRMPWRQR